MLQATVLRCLEELPGETVLVLDDFHVLDETPAAQELADFLLRRLPPHAHGAIASRTRPALRGLPRLLVQGEAAMFDRASHAFMSNICRHLGRLKQSARANEDGLRIDAASGSLDTQSLGLLNRGRLALVRLEPTAALLAFRVALRYAEERQSLFYRAMAWAGLAEAHVLLGSLEPAAQALEQARAIHVQVGERTLDRQLLVIAGDLALLRGDPRVALASYRRVLDDSRDGELATARVQAHLGLARVAAKAGEVESALAHARTAVDLARREDLGSLLPVARLTEAAALATPDEAPSALAALQEAERIFAAWGCQQGRAWCAWLEARVLARSGVRTARRRLDTALARAILRTSRQRQNVVPWLRAEAEWVAPLLVHALTRHERSSERLLVAVGAGAVEPLLVALERRNTRLPAVRALAAIGDPRARRSLQQLLRDGDRRVRKAAARALRTVALPAPPELRITTLGRFESPEALHPTSSRFHRNFTSFRHPGARRERGSRRPHPPASEPHPGGGTPWSRRGTSRLAP